MKRIQLGQSGLSVSEFCLGSMTWGSQNTEAEGHAQIDRALEAGIDFIDTAEMYPTHPVKAETVGRTEEIVGSWLARSGRRGDVTIATKVAGKNGGFVRDGRGLSPETLTEALEGSLRRLGTDVIDLYQIHWPDRGSYHFRQNWSYDPTGQDRDRVVDNIAAVMEALKGHVAAGRIRAFGLSNETVWGTMQWLAAAQAAGGPRVATQQNEYSLVCRQFDTDHAEMSHHEGIVLLAYSPLAAGLLTGKYQEGKVPEGSRMSRTPDLGGRRSDRIFGAVAAYHDVARRYGLDPVQMALAWTRTRPVTTVPILGATGMDQLDLAIGAADLVLSDEVLDEIDTVHKAWPLPY